MRENAAGRQTRRPRGDERHARAALGQLALFADERRVERTVFHARPERRAVVAGKDNEGVTLESAFAQGVSDEADAIVDRRDESQTRAAFWIGYVGETRRVVRSRF